MIILKIAFRNLWEHQTKTLIVGILIALGAFIMVAGNSFMDSVTNGLRKSYSQNYTGDLVIHGQSSESFSLMPGPAVEGGTPVIENFAQVKNQIDNTKGVAATLPIITGMATVGVDESNVGFSFLWAIDYQDYQNFFKDNLVIVAGNWPSAPQATVIISQKVLDDASKEAGHPVKVGDKITLSGLGVAGTKIREVTIAAVFKFKRGGDMLDQISLVDPDTLRSLNNLTALNSSSALTTTNAGSGGSSALDEDALFGTDSLTSTAVTTDSQTNFDSILGDTSGRAKYAKTDANAWNFLLVKLAKPGDASFISANTNAWFGEQKLSVAVSDWRWAAGMQAQMAFVLQSIFSVIVIIIVIVAVIIIMNTLVISVTERTPEIGTMRAIGAKKSFVRLMIMVETLIVSLIFGVAGMAAGSLAILGLNIRGIAASGQFLESLFGGTTLYPALSASATVTALLAVIAIGILSCLYPIAVALKVPPVRAMQR